MIRAAEASGIEIVGKVVRQAFINGNEEAIFGAITKFGKKRISGAYDLPGGATVYKYFSSTDGAFSIGIKFNGISYKIRITP